MNFEEAPKTSKEVARLFGDTAKQLKEGQKLIVKITSIEGRTIAILESVEEKKVSIDNISKPGELCPLCCEPLDNGKSHGSWCK